MKPLGLNTIREKFLAFFESKDHLRMKSFPLVPHNDKSLLLINSGMAPLKPYFTGQEIPPSPRVTTCQKCIRLTDVDNVGVTSRHGTFFEMLGNFSFGDYFKEEIIPWAWEFLTKELEIPEARLFVSVYEEDDETYQFWHEKMHLPKEKIVRLGKDDNFWEVGLGPCGPCSEIYFDRGEGTGCGQDTCAVGCECDRFVEVWNLVFTQFNKEEDGSYSKLAHPNIDTGMGLERIACMLQGVFSLFDVDTMQAIRDKICALAQVQYGVNPKHDLSIRIITDHIRSVVFMTSDGILPSNEGRGYVLRRLLRRAARHGKLLGIEGMFLAQLSNAVIDVSKDAYSELVEKREHIQKALAVEEQRFYETLDQGTLLLNHLIDQLQKDQKTVMSGADGFRLYDTYGFPVDLTEEILKEQGLTLDLDQFKTEMESQKKRARAAREETTYMGAAETIYNRLPADLTTEFLGYTNNCVEGARLLAIVSGNEIVTEAANGDSVALFLDKTVLYAESGGQTGDLGEISWDGGTAEICDCIKVGGGKVAHVGKITSGRIAVGASVTVTLDKKKRMATARAHSCAHLLQRALREVLGNHVEQAGSYVSLGRLRFDFTHYQAMTPQELKQVEDLVVAKIFEELPVCVEELPIEDAKKRGAMALFGEKYGDTVRVVSMGDYSVELCGGTHLHNTVQIGTFKLLSESGVAAGVRRIEALTGEEALRHLYDSEAALHRACQLLKATPENVTAKIEGLSAEIKDLNKQLAQFKSTMASGLVDGLLEKRELVQGISAVIACVDEPMDGNALRELADKLRDRLQSGVVFLAGKNEDKVNLVAMTTKDWVGKGLHMGNIIKETAKLVGGGGGGRPDMAQAGGRDGSKIGDALALAREVLAGQVR